MKIFDYIQLLLAHKQNIRKTDSTQQSIKHITGSIQQGNKTNSLQTNDYIEQAKKKRQKEVKERQAKMTKLQKSKVK